MSIIDSVFQPLIGKICWDVENGVGSFLTFQFGEPHVEVIREPRLSKSKKSRVVRHSARRLVRVYGDWYLWIYLCDWRFSRNGTFIGGSKSNKRELKQIALDLEGQALVSVKVIGGGITVFEFDLGGRLETQPFLEEKGESEPDELWLLYQPSGMVFTFRSDGKYNHQMGNEPPVDQWLPIEEYTC